MQLILKLDSFVDNAITSLASAVHVSHTIPLLEDIHIISLATTGLPSAEIANQVEHNVDFVERVLATRDRIKKCRSPNPRRRFLELSDKLRVICRAEYGESRKNTCEELKISSFTYRLILNKKIDLEATSVAWESTGCKARTNSDAPGT